MGVVVALWGDDWGFGVGVGWLFFFLGKVLLVGFLDVFCGTAGEGLVGVKFSGFGGAGGGLVRF